MSLGFESLQEFIVQLWEVSSSVLVKQSKAEQVAHLTRKGVIVLLDW